MILTWIARRLARPVLLLVVALGLLRASDVSAQQLQAPPAPDRTINLLAWADYLDPKVIAEFSALTGITVVQDSYESNAAALERLARQGSGYDLAILSGNALASAVRAGLLQKLPATAAERYRALWPDLADRLKLNDPGNQHGVAYIWGTLGIGLNLRKVRERLGPAQAINTWDLLLRPDIAARLKDCGIAFPETPDDFVPAVAVWAGGRSDLREARDQQKAADALMRVRQHVRKFHDSDHVNGLATGELCIAVSSSLDAMQAARRAEDARNGVEITYVVPREGAPLWFDVLALPGGSARSDLAVSFIDFLARPDIAARNAEMVLAASGTRAASALMRPELRAQAGLFPDEATFRRLYLVPLLDEGSRRAVQRLWQRVRTGR